MKKTFVFLLSTLFLASTADICLARGRDHGALPPERGQNRGVQPAGRREAVHSMRQATGSADSEKDGQSDSFKKTGNDEEQSGRFDRRRDMNPPPPPPLDENGNPLPPPDEDGNRFDEFGDPPPPPPLDRNGNPLPPPDDGDFGE